ncbi:hypothetical protein AB0L70_10065 [Kribbella sp. NPDC051952]|uniref:hypothetical protein n=1 Tax=Kribbella sp. NPDC051952 TaxID=3154851 RepID=UPI00341DE3AE
MTMTTENLQQWIDARRETAPELLRHLAQERTRRSRGDDEPTNPIAAMAERNGGSRLFR